MAEIEIAQKDRRKPVLIAALAWIGVAAVLLAWEYLVFGRLLGHVSEWQFAHLGRFFPLGTMLGAFLLACLPVALFVGVRHRRREGKAESVIERALRRSASLQRACAVGAIMAAIMAVILFAIVIVSYFQAGSKPMAEVDAATPALYTGPARLAGPIDRRIIVRLHQGSFLLSRNLYIAPVQTLPLSETQPVPLHYFAELRRSDRDARQYFTPVRIGYLASGALNEETIALLRTHGYAVAPDAAILFDGVGQVTWREWWIAWQAVLFAVLLGVAWRLERKRTERLVKIRDGMPTT